jgi:hypothetical protein
VQVGERDGVVVLLVEAIPGVAAEADDDQHDGGGGEGGDQCSGECASHPCALRNLTPRPPSLRGKGERSQ